MIRAVAAVATLLLSEVLVASQAPAAAPVAAATPPGGLGGQLAQMVFGLLLVVGLIFALAWLLRRMQGAAPRGGQVIEIIGSRCGRLGEGLGAIDAQLYEAKRSGRNRVVSDAMCA